MKETQEIMFIAHVTITETCVGKEFFLILGQEVLHVLPVSLCHGLRQRVCQPHKDLSFR